MIIYKKDRIRNAKWELVDRADWLIGRLQRNVEREVNIEELLTENSRPRFEDFAEGEVSINTLLVSYRAVLEIKYYWPIWLPIPGNRPWVLDDQHGERLRNKGGEGHQFASPKQAFAFAKRHKLAILTPQILKELRGKS